MYAHRARQLGVSDHEARRLYPGSRSLPPSPMSISTPNGWRKMAHKLAELRDRIESTL